MQIEIAPLNALAEVLGLSNKTIRKILKELNLAPHRVYIEEARTSISCLTREQVEAVIGYRQLKKPVLMTKEQIKALI